MSTETEQLLHELRNPHTDFPSYYEGLCKRAAEEIERLESVNQESGKRILGLISQCSRKRVVGW